MQHGDFLQVKSIRCVQFELLIRSTLLVGMDILGQAAQDFLSKCAFKSA